MAQDFYKTASELLDDYENLGRRLADSDGDAVAAKRRKIRERVAALLKMADESASTELSEGR